MRGSVYPVVRLLCKSSDQNVQNMNHGVKKCTRRRVTPYMIAASCCKIMFNIQGTIEHRPTTQIESGFKFLAYG